MNQARSYLFVLLFVGLFALSCDKKVVYPATVTPAPKPVFSGGFNGESFNNSTTSDWSHSQSYSKNILTVGIAYGQFYYLRSSYGISIQFYAKDTGIYLLSNKNIGTYAYANEYNPAGWDYYTDSIHTGQVKLTELDTINRVASGTFWFACEMQYPAPNGGLDTIKGGYFNNFSW